MGAKGQNNVKYIIIGAGPSGLAIAHYLTKAGKDILILERSDSIGGLARRWMQNGFWTETGPHIFHSPDSEITSDWKTEFTELLKEKEFYAGNIHPDFPEEIFDYPLNVSQLKKLGENNTRVQELYESIVAEKSKEKVGGKATNFREYTKELVGEIAESLFFREYPEKLWGIPTNMMVADWAPKRIRLCEERESFFEGQYSAAATNGAGSVFEKIVKGLTKESKILFNTEVIGIGTEKDRISTIRVRRNCGDIQNIELSGEQRLISSLPITTLAKFLGIDANLRFRGVCSSYFYGNSGTRGILPEKYNFLYYHDKNIIFNRVTEPTRMAEGLQVENKNGTYIVVETSYDRNEINNEESKNKFEQKIKQDVYKVLSGFYNVFTRLYKILIMLL